jgi:multisubunit Na+/H+ antiporter MnhB subunit
MSLASTGGPGYRFAEFAIFAGGIALIILVPLVIDLFRGGRTPGLARSTIANTIVATVALGLALLLVARPFGKNDPNLELARLVLVSLTTTLAAVSAFYFGSRTATEAMTHGLNVGAAAAAGDGGAGGTPTTTTTTNP